MSHIFLCRIARIKTCYKSIFIGGIIIYIAYTLVVAPTLHAQPFIDSLRAQINQANGVAKLRFICELTDSLSLRLPDSAIHYARMGLAMPEANKSDSCFAQLTYLYGYAFLNIRAYDSALVYFNIALEIFEANDDVLYQGIIHNRIGQAYQYSMQYPLAYKEYQKALNLSKKVDNKKTVGSALNSISNILRLLGDHERALEALIEASEIFKAIDYEEGYAWTAFNLAKYYNTMERYEEALIQANISLGIYEKMAEIDGIRVGVVMVLSVINTIHLNANNIDSALFYSERCLEESEQGNIKTGVADALSVIGRINLKQKKYPEAIFYLERSIKTKETIGDQLGLCSTNIDLARCHIASGSYIIAQHYLEAAKKLAVGNNFRIYMRDIYKTYAELASAQGDFKNAYMYYIQHVELQDSITNVDLEQKIAGLKFRYDVEKKEQENLLLKKNLDIQYQVVQRQQMLIVTTLFMLLGFAVLAVIILKSRRRLKSVNSELTFKNKEIEEKQIKISQQNLTLEEVNQKLEEKNQILYINSITDELTQVYNRSFLFTVLMREFSRAQRHQLNLICMMLDIDHFKTLNDKYGHLAGDLVLHQSSKLIREHLRNEDVFGRYGGEEFMIILPDTDLVQGLIVAEKIRSIIENQTFKYHSHNLKITFSMGISDLLGSRADTMDTFIRCADDALYQAKRNGRNQVRVCESPSA